MIEPRCEGCKYNQLCRDWGYSEDTGPCPPIQEVARLRKILVAAKRIGSLEKELAQLRESLGIVWANAYTHGYGDCMTGRDPDTRENPYK